MHILESNHKRESEHSLVIWFMMIALVVFSYYGARTGSIFANFIAGFIFAVILESWLQSMNKTKIKQEDL